MEPYATLAFAAIAFTLIDDRQTLVEQIRSGSGVATDAVRYATLRTAKDDEPPF